MDLLVELRAVLVLLGGKTVLRDLTLELAPGSTLGIAGPNGSGKTTLARVLATLQRIETGDASILGCDATTPDVYQVRRQIGMVGHIPALIPELTLEENLVHMARIGEFGEDRVAAALDVVGLGDAARQRADEASFGMNRRIEFAHLLIRKPRLVLLDEAVTGLDENAIELIGAVIQTTTERGGGVVLVSHDKAQLSIFSDVVMNLDSGRLEVIN